MEPPAKRPRKRAVLRSNVWEDAKTMGHVERYRDAFRGIKQAGLLGNPIVKKVFWLAGPEQARTQHTASIETWLRVDKTARADAEHNHVEPWLIPQWAEHPAAGQMGLRAKRAVAVHGVVGEYIGTYKLVPAERSLDTTFVFGFSEQPYDTGGMFHGVTLAPLAIDALDNGLFMHFINDYRNVEAEPNVAAVEVWEVTQNAPRIFIVALRSIGVREELLLDYGAGFWREKRRRRAPPEPPAPPPEVIDLTCNLQRVRLTPREDYP